MPRLLIAALATAAATLACASARADDPPPAAAPKWSGEVRAQWDPRWANDAGLVAQADALAPGLAQPQRSGGVLELGLRGHERFVSADVLLRAERDEGGAHDATARFNELYVSGDVPGLGADWPFSAGRKIVGWDVGYAWRPNDVVEQEQRRQLLATTPEGRPVIQLEHFDAETAWTWVWVNPNHLNTAFEHRAFADESALAMRVYRRAGAVDWHGFLRWGEHTQGSVGGAVAWVATESVELHASARFATRHDAWVVTAPAGAIVSTSPWQVQTQGAAPQWLVGGTWTNADQWSLLAEAFHDGSAANDANWDAWVARNHALVAAGSARTAPLPLRMGAAANLAWQTGAWNGQNLRQDNVYLRLSWQHEAWQPALDLLYTPADRGRSVTASLAWQGDRLKLEGGLRAYGGPADAVMSLLPWRRTGYVAATLAF